jgi:hypothetical protein
MTIERPAFRVVGGTDFTPASETEAPSAHGRQKRQDPHKDRKPKTYQKRLPLIDPAGERDGIFRSIAEHRAASAHYDSCVAIESDAEFNVSEDEFFYLQHNTRNAFETMMLWARAVILDRPTTRRGLIYKVRYLVSQFDDPTGCNGGCTHLPDKMNGHPWPLVFLNGLVGGLRKMAGELEPQDKGVRQ